MPTRTEQAQHFCNRCLRPTLHQAQITETNHVLHLLLTLFCCGFWLPIWLLIAIVEGSQRVHFLCTICGQPAGELTEGQRIQHAQQKAATSQQRAAARAEMAAAVGAGLSSAGKGLGQAASFAVTAGIQEVKQLPARTDNLLKIIAGEGNDLIFWFLRIFTVVGLSIGFVLIGLALLKTVATFAGR